MTYLVQGEGVGDQRMQSAAPSQWSSASWPRNNPGVICAGSSCLASQAKERCQANQMYQAGIKSRGWIQRMAQRNIRLLLVIFPILFCGHYSEQGLAVLRLPLLFLLLHQKCPKQKFKIHLGIYLKYVQKDQESDH